jgi:hypothetical protein
MLSWFRHPRNSRDWETELAEPAVVSFAGDAVRVKHLRCFAYRTPTDFTPAYDDQVFAVSGLASVDMVVSYWTGPAIAHVFLSFGFADGQYLAVSIEIRRVRGQQYSALAGFFRQYELLYVVADERDLIGQRLNARGERVYLYRLQITPELRRTLFLSYMQRVAKLAEAPEFYHTALNNCTTNIFRHANAGAKVLPFNWKVLASGYADRYAYDLGVLDQSLTFPALKAASRVKPVAEDAGFSRKIREGLPGTG